MNGDQDFLFDVEEFAIAEREWKGMPEYSHRDLEPKRQIIVNFESDEDVSAFAKLVGQKFGPNVKSIWYPEVEIGRFIDKRYADES